jgi:hypothetical protein
LTLLLLLSVSVWADDWTTTSGTTYHDVKIVKIEADYVTIQDSDGGAKIDISKLPPDIQKTLNYDPVKAKAAMEAREQQQDAADASQTKQDKAAAAKQAADDARRKEALQHPFTAWGSVIEKLPEGMLIRGIAPAMVRGPDGSNILVGLHDPSAPNPVYGIFFLKNDPDQDQLIDGAEVKITVYADGPYSYQTTDGSISTIDSYTAQPPKK